MATQTTGGGSTTSFTNTPQAEGDLFTSAQTGLTEDSSNVVYLNVMANDLGGNAKILWSVDNDVNNTGAMSGYIAGDLLTQDTGRVEATSSDTSFYGAKIWITSDGQVGYDASALSAAFKAQLQTLQAGQFLYDTFTYAIRLGNGTLSWATATVQFGGANDAAAISGAMTNSVVEAGGVANAIAGTPTATGTLTDTDVDNTPNTFQAASGSGANSYGTFTMTTGGVWIYTLNNNNSAVQAINVGQTLTDTFTVHTQDGTAQLVTVTINGANDAAVISGTASGSVIEAGGVANAIAGTPTATGTLTDTDVDNSPNTFQAASGSGANSYGTFTMTTGGVWTYTLNNNNSAVQGLKFGQTLTDSFTVHTQDGTAQLVTVTINGTNDGATITGTATGAVTEDGTLTASGTLTAHDVDTGENHFQAVAPAALAGTYGSFTFNELTGAWDYTLNNAAANVQALTATAVVHDTLTVTSVDGTASQIIDVTINGTNDGATITGTATGAVTEDGTLTASGTLTAHDVDTGENHFQAVAPAALAGTYGSFTFNELTGAWDYTLNNAAANVQALTATAVVHDTLTVTSVDGTASQIIDVTINGTNDAPVLNANGGSLSNTENQAAAAIDTALTASDVDSANLTGATVSITGNFVSGQDVLGFTTQNGITGSYVAATGILTLSGTATVAQYQAALESVTYFNSSDNPSGATRTISYQVDDGQAANHAGNIVTSTVSVTPVNDAPTAAAPASYSATEQVAVSLKSASLSVSDVDGGSGNETLTLSVAEGTLTAAAGNSGATVSGSGSASLTVSGTLAQINSFLGSGTASTSTLSYSDNTDTPSASTTLSLSINDNGNTGTGGSLTGGASSTINITAVNDAPALTATAVSPTFTEAAGLGTQAAAVSVFSGANANTIESGQTIKGLTFTVGGVVDGANDKIVVDGTAVTLGANSSGTTATNGMSYTVTIVSGTATVALTKTAGVSTSAINTLVNGITYQDTNLDNPTAGSRTFTLTSIQDSGGTANGGVDTTSLSIASNVTVVPVNDAPTTVADIVFTNVGTSAAVVIPDWALLANDTDPDSTTLSVTNISNVIGASGSGATHTAGNVTFNDNGILGGSFDYQTSDGSLSGAAATVTITNNANSNNAIITGTAGNDIMIGGGNATNVTLSGGSGNDIIIAASNNKNTSIGGAGNDVILLAFGGNGSNSTTITGDASAAQSGTDSDTLLIINQTGTGTAIDLSVTGTNNEDLTSGDNATVTGFENVDASRATLAVTLTGSSGVNKLIGGTAANSIKGLGGADVLTGGGGADIFKYTLVSDSNHAGFDTITDFTSGSDKIQFNTTSLSGIASSQGVLSSATDSVAAHKVAWFVDTANNQTIVYANNTGAALNGGDAGLLEIHLSGAPTLTGSDFTFGGAPAGIAGEPINLGLTDPSTDYVGAITVTVGGVPTGWTLSGGTNNGDGTWTVQTNNVAALAITSSDSYTGALMLNITESYTNADGSTGTAFVNDNVEVYAKGTPIFAVSSDDTLTGSGANDEFVFAQPISNDTIYDFNVATDQIDLVGINAVAELQRTSRPI